MRFLERVKKGLRNACAEGTRLGQAAIWFRDQDSQSALLELDIAKDRQPGVPLSKTTVIGDFSP